MRDPEFVDNLFSNAARPSQVLKLIEEHAEA
jgi:hypothetical protein